MTSSQEVFGNGSLKSSLPEIDCPGRHFYSSCHHFFNSAESWSGFRKFPGKFGHLKNHKNLELGVEPPNWGTLTERINKKRQIISTM